MTTSHESFLKLAIELAEKSVDAGQTPFGAVIVQKQTIVAATHNEVWKTTDPTAHAEINAIRLASKKLNTIDLSGCVLYSSCEPCPMCFAAIHWAKIDAVYFSARIHHARKARFSELSIPNEEMKERGQSPVKIYGDLLPELANRPFEKFLKYSGHRAY